MVIEIKLSVFHESELLPKFKNWGLDPKFRLKVFIQSANHMCPSLEIVLHFKRVDVYQYFLHLEYFAWLFWACSATFAALLINKSSFRHWVLSQVLWRQLKRIKDILHWNGELHLSDLLAHILMVPQQLWVVPDLPWAVLALNHNVLLLVWLAILVMFERRLRSLANQLLWTALAVKFRVLISVVGGSFLLVVELTVAAVMIAGVCVRVLGWVHNITVNL